MSEKQEQSNDDQVSLAALLWSEDGWEGTKLARYKLESLLGEGGMGRVFLAQDVILQREIALKAIPESVREARETGHLEQFLREAQAVAKMEHPNIVRVYDIVNKGDVVAVAMEYVSGGTLKDLIEGEHDLEISDFCEMMAGVARGLACAHENGMVHRDIKPANIMLTDKKLCKIVDFGATHEGNKDELTILDGLIIGTPYFISPEVIEGGIPLPESDIYSLGIILWWALAGRPPFLGEDRDELYDKHLCEPPPDISDYNPDIPRRLKELINSCLEKNPADRIGDAAELSNQLSAIARSLKKKAKTKAEPVGKEVDPSPPSRPESPTRKAKKKHAKEIEAARAAEKQKIAEQKKRKKKIAVIAFIAGTIVFIIICIAVYFIAVSATKDKPEETPAKGKTEETALKDTSPPAPVEKKVTDTPPTYFRPKTNTFLDSTPNLFGSQVLGDEGTVRAFDAIIHPDGTEGNPRYEAQSNDGSERNCLGFWSNANAWVSWDVKFKSEGTYEVEVIQAMLGAGGSTYRVSVGDQTLNGEVQTTGSWSTFVPVKIGTVKIDKAGPCTISFKPVEKQGTSIINLRGIKLKRVK